MDRKEFIKSGGRFLMMGGFVFFSGYLLVNKRISKASDCSIADKCAGCNKFSTCELPQATKTKKDGEKS